MNPSLSSRDSVQNGAKHLPSHLYADLVGKPFVEGGRGPDVYDCVGLASEIQRRRGLTVPEFYSSEAELHRQISGGGCLADCGRLSEPEPGCVALFWMLPRHGVEHHLGTMVSRFRMIHTTAQTKGVVIESILLPLWECRILGFYRLGVSGFACGGFASGNSSTYLVGEQPSECPRLSPGIGYYPDPEGGHR